MSRRSHPPAAELAAFTTSTGDGGAQLAELLRNVLLSVRNSPAGASAVPPLTQDAEAAIAQFRSIDAALATATNFTQV